MELKKRLLASIETHGRTPYKSLVKLFPHERTFSICRGLIELRNEGWLKLNRSYLIDKFRVNQRCILRTRKQLYSQPKVFNTATL